MARYPFVFFFAYIAPLNKLGSDQSKQPLRIFR
jgi:hypothetical protein